MMEAEQMKALIEKARDHKMTPAERFEQRVSFVYSGVSSTTTREDVRARLAEEYGDPMAYEARISDLEAQLAEARSKALEEAAQIVLAMSERETARGDTGVPEWIDAWDMAFDTIRALKEQTP